MVDGSGRRADRSRALTTLNRWTARHLNYSFSDIQLLELALSHRSVGNINNERLEFLGDALLNLAIAERLYELFPEYTEGELSRLRASLVNSVSLEKIAAAIELDRYIQLSKAERASGGARRSSILANAVEAIIGAVLLDGGHDMARRVVDVLYTNRLQNLPSPDDLKDSKTRLQEWLQARGASLPVYSVVDVAGADHAQTFTVSCQAMEEAVTAKGGSRRAAEQAAAGKVLELLTRDG